MWNNNNNYQGQAPSFPSPNGGYNPGYAPSYAPPNGPPPHGYGPPPGPPPQGYGGGYGPPPGPPPSGYGGPHHHNYAPPSGPPVQGNTYPGQQHHQERPQHHTGYPGSHEGHVGYGGPPPPPIHSRPQGYGPPPMPPSQQQNYGPQYETRDHHQAQPYFQYSQCTGKKKALLIGINYTGLNGALAGCVNDAKNIQRFLTTHYDYKEEDMVLLTDDARNARQHPTRENIINAMHWLVSGASPNDSLFFHYSGHGGQTEDLDGDEADGFDEVIYPVDHEQAGHIVDDDMHDWMVKPLPPGCRLTAIFDSCHSGSALDLPYIYSTEGKLKEPNLAAEAGQGLLGAVTSYARGDMGGVFKSAMGLVKTAAGKTQKAEKLSRATKTSPADVISWSGCKDSQTSADTQEAGEATGAMSYAFIAALSQNKQQSFQELLVNLRAILKSKYSQKPQLSSSHPMDTNLLFIC